MTYCSQEYFIVIIIFCLGQYYSIISANDDSYDVVTNPPAAGNSNGVTTRSGEGKTILSTPAPNDANDDQVH